MSNRGWTSSSSSFPDPFSDVEFMCGILFSCGGKSLNLEWVYEGAPKYDARRKRSLNTPAAVTSAPAPGPLTIRGCFEYLDEVKAMILSVPESWANASDFFTLFSSTLPSAALTSTTPTYRKTCTGKQKSLFCQRGIYTSWPGKHAFWTLVMLHLCRYEDTAKPTSPAASASFLWDSISWSKFGSWLINSSTESSPCHSSTLRKWT